MVNQGVLFSVFDNMDHSLWVNFAPYLVFIAFQALINGK